MLDAHPSPLPPPSPARAATGRAGAPRPGTEYAVWHGRRMEYAQVPMAVITDERLAHATVRVYAYMLGVLTRPVAPDQGQRWIIRRRDVMRRCGIGEQGWTRATRELTAVGLYRGEHRNLPAGTMATDTEGGVRPVGGQRSYLHHVYPAEQAYRDDGEPVDKPHPREPGGGVTGGGSPPGGKPSPLNRGTDTKKSRSSKAAARKRSVRAAAPTGQSAERLPALRPEVTYANNPAQPPTLAPAPVSHKRKRIHLGTGAAYWYDDEVVQIEALVEAYGLAAVRAAVTLLRSRGFDPLPSWIDSRLRDERREAHAEATRAKRRSTGAEDRATADAKARAALAEYTRGPRSESATAAPLPPALADLQRRWHPEASPPADVTA